MAAAVVGLLSACPPPSSSFCPPGLTGTPSDALIALAGPVAPFTIETDSRLCFIADDALSATVTLRGPGVTVSPTVSGLRFDTERRRVALTVDVGTLPAGAYVLQVIIDPAVASTTVPLLVAADRSAQPVVRRTFSSPCDTPRVTSSGTVFCREPVFTGQQHGWRVERPGGPAMAWREAIDVSTSGDVVWALERADASVQLRRFVESDGGLQATHQGQLDPRARALQASGAQRAIVSGSGTVTPSWAAEVEPDAATVASRPLPQLPFGPYVVDDGVPLVLDEAGVSWCQLADGGCSRLPVAAAAVGVDATHGWFRAPRSGAPVLFIPSEPPRAFDLVAFSRPLGEDAGVVLSVSVPLLRFVQVPSRRDVRGALVFSTDAGLFTGRLVQGALALERLPPLAPVDVTGDWVVAQPSPTTLELLRLRP